MVIKPKRINSYPKNIFKFWTDKKILLGGGMDLLYGLVKRAERGPVGREKRCMNCGRVIEHEATDVYSRRFCSGRCKENYLYKK